MHVDLEYWEQGYSRLYYLLTSRCYGSRIMDGYMVGGYVVGGYVVGGYMVGGYMMVGCIIDGYMMIVLCPDVHERTSGVPNELSYHRPHVC